MVYWRGATYFEVSQSVYQWSTIISDIVLWSKFHYTVKDLLQRKTHYRVTSVCFPVYTIKKIMYKNNEISFGQYGIILFFLAHSS